MIRFLQLKIKPCLDQAVVQPGIKPLATKQTSTQTEWSTLRLSDAQLDEFHTIVRDQLLPLIKDSERDVDKQFFSIGGIKASELGAHLHPLEIAAIKFYTLDGFRAMNGSFDHDESIKKFMENRKIDPSEFENVKKAGKLFSLIATSGLNKLPAATDPVLYRGSSLSEERLKNMKPGTVINMNRFTSTSTGEGTANQFTQANITTDKNLDVIYVITNPKKAKNITMLSGIDGQKEAERTYGPHTSFTVEKTSIEEEPDLMDITYD